MNDSHFFLIVMLLFNSYDQYQYLNCINYFELFFAFAFYKFGFFQLVLEGTVQYLIFN